MFSLAIILALFPPGFAAEKNRRGKASRFREAAKVAFCETSLKVVGFQLSILFPSLSIYFDSCTHQERLNPENCIPYFRSFLKRRNLQSWTKVLRQLRKTNAFEQTIEIRI